MSSSKSRLIVSILCLGNAVALVATAYSSKGSIAIFSDTSCHDSVLIDSPTIPLEQCLPATTSGQISLSFIVSDKPFCADGSRPDLLQYSAPCCSNGIANWAPNALYGDYGNGSCQFWGYSAGFRSMVFSCGEFEQAHQPTAISASATFPAPEQSAVSLPDQCLGFVALSTTSSARAAASTAGSEIATTSFSPISTTSSAVTVQISKGAAPRLGAFTATLNSIFLVILSRAVA